MTKPGLVTWSSPKLLVPHPTSQRSRERSCSISGLGSLLYSFSYAFSISFRISKHRRKLVITISLDALSSKWRAWLHYCTALLGHWKKSLAGRLQQFKRLGPGPFHLYVNVTKTGWKKLGLHLKVLPLFLFLWHICCPFEVCGCSIRVSQSVAPCFPVGEDEQRHTTRTEN